MKYLYTSLMFIAVHTVFSQTDLYVANNPAIYVYVDGSSFMDVAGVAPLYITNGVDLAGANSKIYLRNEAQLLQGNNVGNSGIGQLSAQQSGTVNQFAYNYWCSPVGNNLLVASGNEDFKVNLIDDATGLITSNDALFTSNLNGTASPTLTIARRWLYTFEVSDEYGEWSPVGESGDIKTGLGFTMKGMGTGATGNQLYDFRGKPNNGNISNNVAAEQFTLIGNPYPSALDAALFLWDSDNVNIDEVSPVVGSTTGAIYYWEQQPTTHFIEDYVGGYASFTCTDPSLGTPTESFVFAPYYFYLADGTPASTPPGTGSKVARRYIPIGQGFMVEGEVGIPTTPVYVKNSMRAYVKESSGNSYFFRNNNGNETISDENESLYDENGFFIVPSDFKRFRIFVNFNDTYSKDLLANFHETATEGFDYGLEAKSPADTSTDAYWVLNDVPYVIQAHSFDLDLKIPLVVKAESQQPLKFGIFDIQNFDESQPIYLHDKDANLYVNLRSQYYSINIPAGSYTNRFEITFTNEQTLSTPEVTAADFNIFQDNLQSQLTILNPNGLNVKTVSMFDTAGKQVFNVRNLNNESEYHFTTKTLSEGVYVATITLGNSKVVSKKVIVKN